MFRIFLNICDSKSLFPKIIGLLRGNLETRLQMNEKSYTIPRNIRIFWNTDIA